MTIDNELIDNLLKGYKKPEDLIGENGLLKQLTKRLLERAMAAEMTEHVGYEKHDVSGDGSGNSRNGKSAKTIKGTFGTLPIEVPRDRNGTFEPQIIEKHQRRFTGFDENIISLYARGAVDPRDSRASGRNLPGGSIAGADLDGDGRGHRRGQGVAEPVVSRILCK